MENGQPAAPRQLAVVRSYGDLINALRARIRELGTTCEAVDYIAGIPLRYCNKLLAPHPPRTIGSQSLGPLLGALDSSPKDV
jgi:hypothetical protein